MDTDDLSIPTYKGIILEAEKFNHDLTLQFGVLASSCKDDDDYLQNAEALIKDWLQENDFEDIIDDIFFGQKVNENAFRNTLAKSFLIFLKSEKHQWSKASLKIGDKY